MTVDITSFMHDERRRGGAPTPDLAKLPGTRLVTAAEPNAGDTLSEKIVKTITGGEKLAVRHLYRDVFEMEPTFKLVISCNQRPAIRGQDKGIWRRVLLVPFTQTFGDGLRYGVVTRRIVLHGQQYPGFDDRPGVGSDLRKRCHRLRGRELLHPAGLSELPGFFGVVFLPQDHGEHQCDPAAAIAGHDRLQSQCRRAGVFTNPVTMAAHPSEKATSANRRVDSRLAFWMR